MDAFGTFSLFLVLSLTVYHFVCEAIIAPSVRLWLRQDLFLLLKELESIDFDSLSENDKRVFHMIYDGNRALINRLHQISISLIIEAEKEYREDAKLRARSERKRKMLHHANQQLKLIFKRSTNVFVYAIFINASGYLIYAFPYLLFSRFLGRTYRFVSRLITLKPEQIAKLIPQIDEQDERIYA